MYVDVQGYQGSVIESLSTNIFEQWTATGSELFSYFTGLHLTTSILLSIFSLGTLFFIKDKKQALTFNLRLFSWLFLALLFQDLSATYTSVSQSAQWELSRY